MSERQEFSLSQKAEVTNDCRTDVGSVSFVSDLGGINLGL